MGELGKAKQQCTAVTENAQTLLKLKCERARSCDWDFANHQLWSPEETHGSSCVRHTEEKHF